MRLFYGLLRGLSPNMEEFFVKVAGDELHGKFGIEFGCSDGGMPHHYLQNFFRDSFAQTDGTGKGMASYMDGQRETATKSQTYPF